MSRKFWRKVSFLSISPSFYFIFFGHLSQKMPIPLKTPPSYCLVVLMIQRKISLRSEKYRENLQYNTTIHQIKQYLTKPVRVRMLIFVFFLQFSLFFCLFKTQKCLQKERDVDFSMVIKQRRVDCMELGMYCHDGLIVSYRQAQICPSIHLPSYFTAF